MIHVLKTVQPYFEDVRCRRKTFELRRNDHNYQEEDYLVLCNFNRTTGFFTGDVVKVRVTYILQEDKTIRGLEPGYVVLGIHYVSEKHLKWLEGCKTADLDLTLLNRSI